MGDQDHARPIAARKVKNLVEHHRRGRGIEVAGRLVGQQQRRPVEQRAAERDALAFAPRQGAYVARLVAGQPDPRQQIGRAQAGIDKGDAGGARRHQHVLDHGEFGQQVEGLEDEAERARARQRARVATQIVEALAAQGDGAAVGAIEQAQAVQQRAFAGARSAADRHRLASGDSQIEVAQDAQAGIALGQAFDDEIGRAHAPSRSVSTGSVRAARHAGSAAASMPTVVITPMKKSGMSGSKLIGVSGE